MTIKLGSILLAALALIAAPGRADAQLEPGTISIEMPADDGALASLTPAYVEAVGQALAARGFTMLDQPGHAALVANLSLARDRVGTAPVHVPVPGGSVTPGGALGGAGAGLNIALPTGKSTLAPMERTRLDIRIHKRGDDTVLWHGAAVTVRAAGTRTGQDGVVATDLIEAILRDYPTQPQDVIGVP